MHRRQSGGYFYQRLVKAKSKVKRASLHFPIKSLLKYHTHQELRQACLSFFACQSCLCTNAKSECMRMSRHVSCSMKVGVIASFRNVVTTLQREEETMVKLSCSYTCSPVNVRLYISKSCVSYSPDLVHAPSRLTMLRCGPR